MSFELLLNLVSASNAATPDILWGFIRAYAPRANPKDSPSLDRLVGYAIRYYQDFVKPKKKYRAATDKERAAMDELARELEALGNSTDGEASTGTRAALLEVPSESCDVVFQHSGRNLGFSQAVNKAVQWSRQGADLLLYEAASGGAASIAAAQQVFYPCIRVLNRQSIPCTFM